MIIQIEVEEVTNKMFLRSAIADGETDDGRKIDITSVIPDGSLHFKIGDRAWLVKMRDCLDAILEATGETQKA